jgi:hypothetical protein
MTELQEPVLNVSKIPAIRQASPKSMDVENTSKTLEHTLLSRRYIRREFQRSRDDDKYQSHDRGITRNMNVVTRDDISRVNSNDQEMVTNNNLKIVE